ncbi:PTS sugar transporter subunit IIB [uncultured Fusobacterium sp.]|uniref:PTS sugar transporter subunit IIB n=1 Tax=uncultured Fusobacterium sp. TaxID=159267 RepID=UPI0025DA3EFD|nr:PTS sugar transporter subunit IIB [uncultured Fusobacterium sp.]
MGLFSKLFKGNNEENKEIKKEEVNNQEITSEKKGNKYKAIIACGSGVATSTMARKKIEKGFEDRGLKIEILQCKIGELENLAKAQKPDFVIHTVVLPQGLSFDCPVFSGVPFLTGVGLTKALDEIINSLK